MKVIYPKRFKIGLFLLLSLLLFFAFSSRYPALNEKLIMGTRSDIFSIAFDQIYLIKPEDDFLMRVFKNFGNWSYTNWKGMTFGLLFSAILLTLLKSLQINYFKNIYRESILGAFIGAPLGICANCVAPVGQGLFTGGASITTALATMISSPSLNIIVITMAFKFLPLPLIFLKAISIAFLLLVVIPIITKVDRELNKQSQQALVRMQEKWATSLSYFFRDLRESIKHISFRTIPLMILAGFLGVLFVEFFPLESLEKFDFTYSKLAFVSFLGVFLPVPIAFDVILTTILSKTSLHPGFLAALFLTLGPTSIYPLSIIWTNFSKKAAAYLFMSVLGIGVIGGLTYPYAYSSYLEYKGSGLIESLKDVPSQMLLNKSDYCKGNQECQKRRSQKIKLFIQKQSAFNISDKITPASYNNFESFEVKGKPKKGLVLSKSFSKKNQLVIQEERYFGTPLVLFPNTTLASDFIHPFIRGRGLAALDLNHDSYIDVVIASRDGIQVFLNNSGTLQFSGVLFKGFDILSVASSDINGDSFEDLVFATYRSGVYFSLNQKGVFRKLHLIGETENLITRSLSLGDINSDKSIDLLLGNWTALSPPYGRSTSENLIYSFNKETNEFEKFNETPYKDNLAGATLSTLISDLDEDGRPEIFIGNDFKVPDQILSKTNFRPPYTTFNTMSYDSGDIDGDGKLDLAIADIDHSEAVSEDYCLKKDKKCIANRSNYNAAGNYSYQECTGNKAELIYLSCLSVIAHNLGRENRKYCQKIPSYFGSLKKRCLWRKPKGKLNSFPDEIKQKEGGNLVFLQKNGELQPINSSERKTYWTWNFQLNDFNNDGLLDIYAANGTLESKTSSPNILLFNENGKDFKRVQSTEAEIEAPTSSYLAEDIDNDGDLDLIVNPVNYPLVILENLNTLPGFTLDIHKSRLLTGIKVIITTDNGKKLIQELKDSGGFQSHRSKRLHFGLSSWENRVNNITLKYPTGEEEVYNGSYEPGLYTIY